MDWKRKIWIISKYNRSDDNEEDEEKLIARLKDKISLELAKANTTNVSIVNAVISFVQGY